MTKTPITLQELRQRIYRKAKSEPTHRFWGLFTHITKMTSLHEAYQQARKNNGAPGIDGKSFADIELEGVIPFLTGIQEELQAGIYRPQANRKVEIPKANGKMRTLQIPCIRDRVVQGALKLILEAIFEADFCPFGRNALHIRHWQKYDAVYCALIIFYSNVSDATITTDEKTERTERMESYVYDS